MIGWYQNVSILDFIEAKDDGCCGDNWNCKISKTPVKSSLPTNQFLQAGYTSRCLTNSVKAQKGENISCHRIADPKLTQGLPKLVFDH